MIKHEHQKKKHIETEESELKHDKKETYNPITASHGEHTEKKSESVATTSHAHTAVEDQELKELVEKNIKWSQVIYNQNKKIKHRLTMMVIGSYIRLFLILAPIILGIIYLPPLMSQWWGQMSGIIGTNGNSLFELGELWQSVSGNDHADITTILQKTGGLSTEQIQSIVEQLR